ncbi:hypothetical protein EYF80_035006 [Liparis tanakae]|uniref:Uncharacterized protein n=1 Tax=Liparis tanakae TaxID=230148 RepID=A0A4Z2GNL3_9TELE|nr:hypothetical protein EYF80_035006 [Liparis tanakae]
MKPIASTESFSRTSTLHLLSRAAFTWKDGFSVVAPIRVTVPHSTRSSFCACLITSRTSLVEALVADRETNRAAPFFLLLLAMM